MFLTLHADWMVLSCLAISFTDLMETQTLLRLLSDVGGAVSPAQAENLVPERASGLYSIFVDQCGSLPNPYGQRLADRHTRLLYVGKASTCLRVRLVSQDLRHKSASTFFRAVGSLLGFRPQAGSLKNKANKNNYVFCPTDTDHIVRWVDEHLSVLYVEVPMVEIKMLERFAINQLRPLLNTQHNPDAIAELGEVRRQCRRIAGM
jgi:hypothetical protein